MPTSRRFKKNQNQKKFQYSKPPRKNRNKIYLAIGIIAVAAVLIAAFLFIDQNALFSAQSPNVTPSSTATSTPTVTSTATPLTSPAGEYSANGTQVLLETSVGNIIIQMRDDKPITTQNFVNLVKEGFYDGTIFHRVIAGFMIQGGANDSINVPTIPDEIGNDNRNLPYTIAMAKTSSPNSATSEFFINVADNGGANNPSFDSTYTVFGTVISGQSVVSAIANAQVTTNPTTGENSQPVNPVTITKALVIS